MSEVSMTEPAPGESVFAEAQFAEGAQSEAAPSEGRQLLPVLQIVHITDLHIKDTSSNAIAVLAAKARLRARFAQKVQSSCAFQRSWTPVSG